MKTTRYLICFFTTLAAMACTAQTQHQTLHKAIEASVNTACALLPVGEPGIYSPQVTITQNGDYTVNPDGTIESFDQITTTCSLILVSTPAPSPTPTPEPSPEPTPTPPPLASITLETSVTQYGITWIFAEPESVGQFVTGDYFVIDDGSVTITSVSPVPAGGRNGSLLNPAVGSNHPFDDRVRAGYDGNLAAQFPLSVSAGDALVSTISRGSESGDWAGATIDSKVMVNTAAVLTVLGAVPPADAFRPSYVDRGQTQYLAGDIDYSAIPLLDPDAYDGEGPMSYYLRGVERPWILFVHEWPGRDAHPHQNMKGYQQRIGEYLSELSLAIMLDTPERQELIRRYVQLGIDYYQVGIHGDGDSAYYVAPVLIVGKLLGDTAMMNAFIGGNIQSVPRDYPDFYLWPDHTSTIVSAIVPPGQTYHGYNVFFKNNTATNREYEHLDPSEWHLTAGGLTEANKDESYRVGQDSHPHVGMVLAARMCGLENQWHHPATFAYIERWMNGEQRGSQSPIVDNIFTDHW